MKNYKKTIGAAFGTIAVFIFSMPDKFIELYKEFMHSGLTPAFMVALAIWTSKEIRNKKLDRRDARWEKILNSIVIAVGAEEKLKPADLPKLRRFFLFSRKATIANPRRNKMMQFLKSSISKKLLAILTGILVTSLNYKFDLQLSPQEIYVMFAGIITYIVGQSHVDGKKAIASAVTAASQVVQASTGFTYDTTYRDMVPTIKLVHDGVNNLLKRANTDDKQALAAYVQLLDIIKSFEHPQPLEDITQEKVSQ